MARGFAHQRRDLNLSDFSVTGGPTTSAGSMADAGTLNEIWGNLRKKSSSINEIPSLGLGLDAKRYEADRYADLYETKAENDSKVIGAQYDQKADEITAKGNASLAQGLLGGLGGIGMGIFQATRKTA